jgi:hypothetical protein
MQQTLMLLAPFISVAIGIVTVLVCRGTTPESHKESRLDIRRGHGRRAADRR